MTNILNVITILLSLILGFLECYLITQVPMTVGIILLAIVLLFCIGGLIILKKQLSKQTDDYWVVPDIIAIILKWVVIVGYAFVVFLYGIAFLSTVGSIQATTVETEAIIQEAIVTDGPDYLIVEYNDQEGTIQRAVVSVYGKPIYLKGDKILVRYNPNDKAQLNSGNLTSDKPLIYLKNVVSNPSIIK